MFCAKPQPSERDLERDTSAVRAADGIGSEAGSSVRKALLSAASLPRDIVEKLVKGSEKK